jgi:hypothetical protein
MKNNCKKCDQFSPCIDLEGYLFYSVDNIKWNKVGYVFGISFFNPYFVESTAWFKPTIINEGMGETHIYCDKNIDELDCDINSLKNFKNGINLKLEIRDYCRNEPTELLLINNVLIKKIKKAHENFYDINFIYESDEFIEV